MSGVELGGFNWMMRLLEVDDNECIDEDDNSEGRYIWTINPK